MKTTLYCQNLKSNKFWEIEHLGSSLRINYGKIGSHGKSIKKEFASSESAKLEYDKLINGKIKNGYCTDLNEKQDVNWSNTKMSEKVFWELLSILNWKKQGDDDLVLKPAVVALAKMEINEIYAFEDLLASKLNAIDTRKHAELLYGKDQSFSADDFLYTRCVALINGPEYYEEILNYTDKLDQDVEFEAILYLAQDAYELKTGKDYEYSASVSYESCTNEVGWKNNII